MDQGLYFKNAVILTVSSLVLRCAGMFFRIYIAGKIGAGGIGLYQLIYTVYTLAVTFATAGLTLVATRVAASALACNQTQTLYCDSRRLLRLGGFLGIVCAAMLYVLAPFASNVWIGDARATLPLQLLAPSLPFMALSAIMRGTFMAQRHIMPNVKAQLFEQAVRIALVMAVLPTLDASDAQQCCAGIVIGNTVSEICSWLYMHWQYRLAMHGFATKSKGGTRTTGLLCMLLPISASQYLTSVLRTIENVLVPNCLALFLCSRALALEQYGALKGMAMPLLFFPFSFIGTLATLLVPEITAAYVKKDLAMLQRLVRRVLRITFLVSILAGLLYTLLANELGVLLYKDASVGFYLHILGPLAPFMYMESMVDGILKGLNQQVASLRYTVCDSILRIALIFLLLPKYGMQGFLFVTIISNLFTSLLNLRRLLYATHLRFHWMRWLILPLVASACATLALHFIVSPLLADASLLVQTLCGGATLFSIYTAVLFLTGELNDIKELLPFRQKE